MTLFELAEAERERVRQAALGRTTERQSTRRETSDEAWEDSPLTDMRSTILALMRERPRTCDEIMELGHSHQTASATINWLMRHGLIVDSGERRRTRANRNAIVWAHSNTPRPILRERPTRRELERRIEAAIDTIDRNHADLTYLRRLLTGEAQP